MAMARATLKYYPVVNNKMLLCMMLVVVNVVVVVVEGQGRDPALWPFAIDSIWNTPIGSNVQFALPTSAIAKSFHSGSGWVDISMSVWIATPSSPIANVTEIGSQKRVWKYPVPSGAFPSTVNIHHPAFLTSFFFCYFNQFISQMKSAVPRPLPRSLSTLLSPLLSLLSFSPQTSISPLSSLLVPLKIKLCFHTQKRER